MIKVEDLNVTLPDFTLREINLTIEENEFFV
jgi:hypothetical protein